MTVLHFHLNVLDKTVMLLQNILHCQVECIAMAANKDTFHVKNKGLFSFCFAANNDENVAERLSMNRQSVRNVFEMLQCIQEEIILLMENN